MRLLDLFCGAGGAAMGYHRAGFTEIVGVDLVKQPRYPFTFVQADAMTYPLNGFDAIHASPPCQDHMETPHRKHGTGWMLSGTIHRVQCQMTPWIVENVPNRRTRHIRPDFALCGCMFGLPMLRRVRWFQVSFRVNTLEPTHRHEGNVVSVVGHGTPSWVRKKLGRNPTIKEYRAAMGIDWMNRDELSQAIPPAYTEFIGKQLIAAIQRKAVNG